MSKRAFDIVFSAIGLGLTAPLLATLSVLVKFSSPGPVFYRGERVGRFGQSFRIFKFRTMVDRAERIGGSSTGADDPRITRVGRFLRRCKLDELPQLLNVLTGTMSFVGPRPEVRQYVDLYTQEERAILQLRPGITDWASIWNSDEGALLAGSDDPDKAYEQLIRPTKLRLQLAYVRRHTLWTDLKIILFTLVKLAHNDFLPREVREVVPSSAGEHVKSSAACTAGDDVQDVQFGTVSELPGMGATGEQLSMLHTRYRLAAQLADGKDVLELACGPGLGLGWIGKSARRVVAGDCDPNMVAIATSYYGRRVEVRQLDALQLPFERNAFDVILLLEAIYFLPDARKFVAEAQRVLRPGGTVMIASANRERADFNASPQAHTYYSAAELKDLLSTCGFEAELFAGYPVRASGPAGRIRAALRRVAVALHLIPKSMAWKTRLKRLVFGRLDPIPHELVVDESLCQNVIPIDASNAVPDYKVIYAIGRRAA